MIEVASCPADLSKWKTDQSPFYLEIFGEASPTIDINFAEVVGPTSTAPTAAGSSPVYEYWWTIGHPGLKPEHHHLFHKDENASIWSNLADPAARVYLFFPRNFGWRIKEVAATVKYLSPVQDQATLSERVSTEWQKLQPIFGDAGSVAGALAPIPGIGAGALAASPILAAISKLQVGSVPPSAAGYNWYVEKVTTASGEDHGVMQGVMWSIPRSMFKSLGGRLTGSLAVTFIQSQLQGEESWTLGAGDLLGHVGIFEEAPSKGEGKKEHWMPSKNSFVHLTLTPVLPAPSPPVPPAPPSS